ncbi:hypothetical protein [Actinomyces wuliandei]|uniref:hypothetical protein n=1 Tax=Actinomyces wuliandei TaxID=2057743 RepID=UPI000FDC7BB7|nr:hypothetical protein [Actinomyces wuliandei]
MARKYQAATYLGLAQGQDLDAAADLLRDTARRLEEQRPDVDVVEIRKAPTLHSVRVELVVEAEGFAAAAEVAESFMNGAVVSLSGRVDLTVAKDKRRLAYATA